MACKHLRIHRHVDLEDSSMKYAVSNHAFCRIGRDVPGMLASCLATPHDGPCWQDLPAKQRDAWKDHPPPP